MVNEEGCSGIRGVELWREAGVVDAGGFVFFLFVLESAVCNPRKACVAVQCASVIHYNI